MRHFSRYGDIVDDAAENAACSEFPVGTAAGGSSYACQNKSHDRNRLGYPYDETEYEQYDRHCNECVPHGGPPHILMVK